jgi:thioredoxin reductase
LLTRDGAPPTTILEIARRELDRYSTVERRHSTVVAATSSDAGFAVRLACGADVHARRLLLAGGVRDQLPSIDGLAGQWGTGVLHCTYCHGYEVAHEPLALYGGHDGVMASARLISQLTSDLLLLTDRSCPPSTDERAWLAGKGVGILETPLVSLAPDPAGVALYFADGSAVIRRALFVTPSTELADGLATSLGCTLDGASRVVVDRFWATSVPGVFAAGDIAAAKKQVVIAAASGAEAAMALHEDLSRDDSGGFRGV